jgi:hypothetical protein
VIRRILLAVGAAAAAGVLAGAVSRALMRVVALAAGEAGAFSWAGTLAILVVFVAAMLPGSLVAAFTTWRGRWLPLAAGALFLFVPATGIASTEIGGSASGFSPVQWLGVAGAGLGVYLLIAAMPLVVLRLIDRFPPRTATATGASRPDPADAAHPVR